MKLTVERPVEGCLLSSTRETRDSSVEWTGRIGCRDRRSKAAPRSDRHRIAPSPKRKPDGGTESQSGSGGLVRSSRIPTIAAWTLAFRETPTRPDKATRFILQPLTVSRHSGAVTVRRRTRIGSIGQGRGLVEPRTVSRGAEGPRRRVVLG